MKRYYLRIIKGIKLKKLNKVINDINKKTKKNKIYLFFDIINCGLRYGAGYNDYNIFAFYNMNSKQRKTFVTRVKNKKLITLCNDPNYSYIFDNKNEFNKVFKKYLNRDFLDIAEINLNKFEKFMENKDIIFAKPNIGESGKGIEKLKKKDFESLEKMYNYIISKNFGVIEELIIQHESLNKLYPLAINSLISKTDVDK